MSNKNKQIVNLEINVEIKIKLMLIKQFSNANIIHFPHNWEQLLVMGREELVMVDESPLEKSYHFLLLLKKI